MTQNEQRKAALAVLDVITDWQEYKQVLAAYVTIEIFTEFEMLMLSLDKKKELKEKGLI